MTEQDQEEEHFESLYHCLECRQVVYLEETDAKLTRRCPNCGLVWFYKITEGL